MCGIIGASHSYTATTHKALATFAYRGPDAKGSFQTKDLALAHARLSIIDPDPRSNQPFFDARRELAIVYNGEIYNYRELRTELERVHRVTFRTSSDTEVLVEGYRVWGKELLGRLRGMFAFAMYDARTHSVLLARDHAGVKPLYYSTEYGGLVFASELKGVVAMLRAEGCSLDIDRDAVKSYPVLGYIPSPHTLVLGIRKLERSTWLLYDLNTKQVTSGSWRPVTQDITTKTELEEAIRRSILEHCIADVPVGTFFSGGVDSSLITSVLHEAGKNLEAFSINVHGRSADEPYFRAIAQHLGVKTQIAEFGTDEFEGIYDYVLSRMDDPIADPSIFPTTFVAQLAAKSVKVVLSGEGADELFLGYSRGARLAHFKGSNFIPGLWNPAFLKTPAFKGKNRIFKEFAALAGDAAGYYLLQASPGRDLASSEAWQQTWRDLAAGEPPWYDRDWYLQHMLFRKLDMATSYASIEGRVPLVGTEIWNTAPHFLNENLKDGQTKAVLKDMLARYVPRELIDRPKAGFGIPISSLLRTSTALRADIEPAISFARELGLLTRSHDEDLLLKRYPDYLFGLVTLYRSLKNLGLT